MKIRINILSEYVDEFIIIEADSTYSGQSKPFFSHDALLAMPEFIEKVNVHKVVNIPSYLDSWGKENYQRDHVSQLLQSKLEPEDILIFGDVDEIPNPTALQNALIEIDKTKKRIGHFAQDMFYYYINNKEVSGTFLSSSGEYKWVWPRKWLGTNVSKWSYARDFKPSEMRLPFHKKNGWRIRDGGWHFSYIGGEKDMTTENRIRKKIQSYSHQEYNTEFFLSNISKSLSKGHDLFGRKRSRFRLLKDYSYLPPYILENFEQYRHLIK